MMKRYLLSIILGFVALTNLSYGQLEINFSDEMPNVNGTVDVDLTVNGFTNISVLQFSAGWDSLVMRFNSVTFTNPALPDFSPSFIGTPMGAANVDEGQFTLSYSDPNGTSNLPDGEVLITVRFDVVGAECDETVIGLTNDPTPIAAFDNNFEELDVTSQSGSIMINGSDCGGGGGDLLTFSVAETTANMGTNVCIPITVENFIEIQTGTGTILWDPEVLSYTGLANIALSGLSGSLNETNTDGGELKFIWSNPDPANPVTLDNGSTIFEICFDVVGDVGDMSPITLSTQGSLAFEWGNDDVDELPLVLDNGKVTVTEVVGDPFVLNVSDITVDEDATNVCVDISVQNFDNILAMQFVITWDDAILSNATPDNFNLASLNSGNFNIDNNCATMSWNVNSGINVADGTEIFSMCFDVIGSCESSSVIDIVSKGTTDLQIIDGSTNEIDFSVNEGSLTVDCENMEPTCSIVSIDKTCSGMSGGNVIVDVNPSNNCIYSWANSSGMEISIDKNLLGVPAGTYILTVTCDGEEACTLTATVENHPDLVIDEDITHAGCSGFGAINVTVSFGSGDYSYNWNPTQDDSPNIVNLNPGLYSLTVTDDDTGCTQTASYTVNSEVEDLVISGSVSDEKCAQGDGSITITVIGGCEPYEYVWSDGSIGNTPFAQNLSGGNYAVTVTDSSVPALTVNSAYEVDSSDPLMMDGAATITHSTGADDGSIEISIIGGTPGYNYNWSGPTSPLPNSNSITGLKEGEYEVTVTDSQGCQDTFGPFLVLLMNIGDTLVELGTVEPLNNEDGFSVLCNGDANGIISGNIMKGEPPFTVELSGDETRTIELDNIGMFTIENLSAGTYTVAVSNSFNTMTVENIVISEPEELTVAIDKGCDSEEQCDGFIDVEVSGGSGDLTYEWNTADLSGASVDGLCQGLYTVLVTDANGCLANQNVDIESCEGMVKPGCYKVRDVITPNGDGVNDQFVVTCISDFPATLEIYDRWGKLVFNQDVYDGTWMGLSNSNEELNEGGYMYIIDIDFGEGRREIMKGTVTLLRD